MAYEQPSLRKKLDYFNTLKELHDGTADDDDVREEQDRLLRARFFHTRGTSPKPQAHYASPSAKLQGRASPHERLERPDALRTTIKGTPQNLLRTRTRARAHLGNLLNPDDTVVPDSNRPLAKHAPLTRSNTESPLMSRKRKRESSIKIRPEKEQIFRGMSFYYVPNDDVAPLRRLRINKAREYGASWTQDVMGATHVIVDKGLQYKDVERIVVGAGKEVVVVSEDYPVDCIRFRAVLDGRQVKYGVPGHPEGEEAVAREEEAVTSLQIKPQHRNSRRWDFAPQPGTPRRSGTPGGAETSQGVNLDVGDERPEEEPDGETSVVLMKNVEAHGHGRNDGLGEELADKDDDELSQVISIMQEFKNLPLDDDDDDDARSTAGQREALSNDEDERVSSEDEKRKTTQGKQGGFGNKITAFEDRFACNQAGTKDAYQDNPNSRTIVVLQSMADYYDRVNDHWRTTGYRKAITTLKRQTFKVTTEEEAFKLPNVGRRIAQKIEEIVTTNKLQRLEYAQDEPADGSVQTFLQIYGVGNKQAQQWIAQGFRTLEDISARAKLNPSQRIGIEHFDDLNTRIPRREVEALGAFVKKVAARLDRDFELIIGGSYRRGSESSNDIDFIVTKPGTDSVAQLRPFLRELVRVLEQDGFLTARLASFHASGDGSKWHGCCVLPKTRGINDTEYRATWRRIDFLLVPESQMGGALLYFTGNDIFNRSMRLLASRKGMRLNQRGLYRNVMRGPNRTRITEGELVEGRDERRIFEILGVKWREPHERWC